MDHQAFAQLLGNYGEFVGAIAVVVTLIYLAVQLRQNTKAMRSAVMQSLFESTNAVWQNNCQSLERTERFFSLGQKPDLTEAEALYLQSWVLMTLRTQENIYYQRKLGIADDRFVSLEKRISGAMSFPPIQRAWQDGFVQAYLSNEYIEFVNNVTQAE